MKIKGIKCGQSIQLLQDINVPDGTEIIVKIQSIQLMSDQERLRRLKEFFERDWEGREDFIKTMEELEKEKNVEMERLYKHFS